MSNERDDQTVMDKYSEWLLDEYFRGNDKHISIPWDELMANEPEDSDPFSDPAFMRAIAEIKNAQESGKSAPEEALAVMTTGLSFRNPVLEFAHTYNRHLDQSHAGEEWAENVLTRLTHAETLEDLHSFGTRDWYVCAILLQSNLPVPRKIIGKLLEKLLTDLGGAKVDVASLGIPKPRRGRPSDAKTRGDYLSSLMFQVEKLTTEQSMTVTEAYAIIAERQHKSPDTIRRAYERFKKERKRRMDAYMAERERALDQFTKKYGSVMRERRQQKNQTGENSKN